MTDITVDSIMKHRKDMQYYLSFFSML